MGAISIQTNVSAMRAHHALSRTQRSLETSLQRLSSGFRINTAGDDAAGLAISENLRADIRSLHQAVRNASDGLSMVNTAEGGMNEVSAMLVRMRELSVQAAPDTLGSTERGFLDQEFDALKSEITRVAEVTQYNGQSLLDGTLSATGLDFQIGIGAGSDSRLTVTMADVRADALTLTTAIGVDTKAKALSAITAIDAAISTVSTQRASLGAYGNVLQSSVNNLQVTVENLTAANSRIRDVDVASETAAFARSQVLVQAGVSMLAQANSTPLSALQLLS